jgi:hypothetical protein
VTAELVIISAIKKVVHYIPTWTIGVTDDPDRRRRELGNPDSWYHWDAHTEQTARDVEAHYVNKGMKGDTDGGGTASYVYIFIE